MVRRPKRNKRDGKVVKRPPLSREEIEEKERQKEDRELRKKELLESQKQNESFIKSCFSIVSAYWGIDNCIVSILSPKVTFDSNVFDEQIFKDTASIDYNSQGELIKITIQSVDLGKVTISLKEVGYRKKYIAIQLNGPSPNFQTTGIEGIKLRLKEVLHKLEKDYKIKIKYNPDYVRFKKIELAFTIAFNKLPSLQTRQLLMRALVADKKRDLKNYSTSQNADYFPIITIEINKKEKHTFYNKIEKAKKNKQIPKKNSSLKNLEVFRYEIELTGSKIAEQLDSHYLAQLTDEMIIQYLELLISDSVFRYIKIIIDATIKCEKMLAKNFKQNNQQNYIAQFLQDINDQLSTTTISDLIDEDIIAFLPIRFLKTNKGETKRRILENFQLKEKNTGTKHEVGKMTSWQVLEIIRVMFHSLEEAKKYGLGTRINPSTTFYKTFPLKTSPLKERNEIFNDTISNNTREKLEDKMLKRILKRFRDGIKI